MERRGAWRQDVFVSVCKAGSLVNVGALLSGAKVRR